MKVVQQGTSRVLATIEISVVILSRLEFTSEGSETFRVGGEDDPWVLKEIRENVMIHGPTRESNLLVQASGFVDNLEQNQGRWRTTAGRLGLQLLCRLYPPCVTCCCVTDPPVGSMLACSTIATTAQFAESSQQAQGLGFISCI